MWDDIEGEVFKNSPEDVCFFLARGAYMVEIHIHPVDLASRPELYGKILDEMTKKLEAATHE